jgi:hypothetical protein
MGGHHTEDVLRRAWELRKRFREQGVFTTGDYLRELARAVPELSADDVAALAAWVDKESTCKRRPAGKPKPMFPLEGEYELRNGRRVAKANALREHMQEALAISDERLAGWDERN